MRFAPYLVFFVFSSLFVYANALATMEMSALNAELARAAYMVKSIPAIAKSALNKADAKMSEVKMLVQGSTLPTLPGGLTYPPGFATDLPTIPAGLATDLPTLPAGYTYPPGFTIPPSSGSGSGSGSGGSGSGSGSGGNIDACVNAIESLTNVLSSSCSAFFGLSTSTATAPSTPTAAYVNQICASLSGSCVNSLQSSYTNVINVCGVSDSSIVSFQAAISEINEISATICVPGPSGGYCLADLIQSGGYGIIEEFATISPTANFLTTLDSFTTMELNNLCLNCVEKLLVGIAKFADESEIQGNSGASPNFHAIQSSYNLLCAKDPVTSGLCLPSWQNFFGYFEAGAYVTSSITGTPPQMPSGGPTGGMPPQMPSGGPTGGMPTAEMPNNVQPTGGNGPTNQPYNPAMPTLPANVLGNLCQTQCAQLFINQVDYYLAPIVGSQAASALGQIAEDAINQCFELNPSLALTTTVDLVVVVENLKYSYVKANFSVIETALIADLANGLGIQSSAIDITGFTQVSSNAVGFTVAVTVTLSFKGQFISSMSGAIGGGSCPLTQTSSATPSSARYDSTQGLSVSPSQSTVNGASSGAASLTVGFASFFAVLAAAFYAFKF